MNKGEREKLVRIFYEASERVGDSFLRNTCCDAIGYVQFNCYGKKSQAGDLFCELFELDATLSGEMRPTMWFHTEQEDLSDAHVIERRQLALCFVAELVKDGFFK